MKQIGIHLSCGLVLLGLPAFAENLETIHIGHHHCAYENTHRFTPGPLRLFSSDNEAEQVANRILRLHGMSLDNAGFVLKTAIGNRIRSAAAMVHGQKRYLLYKQSFIQDANRRAGTEWAGISIMAHEIAHHLLFHTSVFSNNRPKDELHKDELRADWWSGFVLYRLGASRDEATAAVKTIASAMETNSHPGRAERVDMIIHGWTSAKEQGAVRVEPVTPRSFVREDPATPVPSTPRVPEPEMIAIRGGTFMMGSPASEKGRYSDEKQHAVTVRDFSIAKHEVTVGEFRRFVTATQYQTDAEKSAGGNQGCFAYNGKTWAYTAGRSWKSPGFMQTDQHPVVCVSQNDALAYVAWLGKQTGKRYGLPTEAQWEYAARAGSSTARFWGDNPDQACRSANVADQTAKKQFSDRSTHNCNDNQLYTAPVGRYGANNWGLKDVLGNVWEWTCSAYDKDYAGTEQRCAANSDTRSRVLRGGSWDYKPENVRSANRDRYAATSRDNNTGFRLSRTP